MHKKLLRFEDMQVWQDSQELAVLIYKVTSSFPTKETYALVDQLRRAASSVSANIAEGYGRGTNKDKAHFYHIARGSLLETKSHLYLAARLDYINQSEADKVIEYIENINSQITAILKYFKDNV